MPRRTAKVASATFVTILLSLPFVTMARGEPAAVDNCLTAPAGETPAGSHWRYHIDHANKRNCWYLRSEDGSQVLPQQSSAPAPAPSPPAKPSVADARAEFRGRPGNEDRAIVNPPATGAANDTGSANSVWGAAPTVATRWPELPPAFQMPKAEPATASPTADATQAPADPPQAAAQPTPFAYLFLPVRPEMLPALIAAALAALALAGAAVLIFRRRGRTRRLRRRVARSARGPLSETTDDDRIILTDYPSLDKGDYRPRFARNVRTTPVADDRAQEFSRRAPKYARR